MPPNMTFPAWSCVMGLLIGACIGSFLNVVIYRVPRGLSLHNPPKSFCPNCKHSLGLMDLFPLLSYVASGGKCRYCKQPVAFRYFLVEVITGALFAGIWYQYFTASYEPLRAIFYAAATGALVAIIFIDWELYIIPDEINAFLLVVAIAYHAIQHSLQFALIGALVGWGALWGIALLGRLLFGKDSMGHGDIKMMRGVGALIGPILFLANIGIAVVAGLVIGIILIAVASRQPQPEPTGEEEDLPPETIGSLLAHGLFYLFCLDIVALFIPATYKLIGESAEQESIDDDDWKPSLTTIPFGPYLAVGALACMLFATPIQAGLQAYWAHATGADVSGSPRQR